MGQSSFEGVAGDIVIRTSHQGMLYLAHLEMELGLDTSA
jgi:hypothetical protein